MKIFVSGDRATQSLSLKPKFPVLGNLLQIQEIYETFMVYALPITRQKWRLISLLQTTLKNMFGKREIAHKEIIISISSHF